MKHDDAPRPEHDAALDDWLAGDLAPGSDAERSLFATMPEDDAALHDELTAHREIRSQVRALALELAPERDLWPQIAARIEVGDAESPAPSGGFWDRTISLPRWAALAALLAVAVGVGLLVGYERTAPEVAPLAVSSPAPLPPAAGVDGRTGPALAAYAETDRALATIREELLRSIEARQAKLPPETRAVVFENLRTIDSAIDEIEAALAAAPADEQLARTYIAYRERQIAVLRQANELAARL